MTLVSPAIDAQGRVILTSRGTTYKVKNVRRDPRVSLLVFGEQFHGSKYVQIHGTAEVIALPEVMDLLIHLAPTNKGGASKLGRLSSENERGAPRDPPHQH